MVHSIKENKHSSKASFTKNRIKIYFNFKLIILSFQYYRKSERRRITHKNKKIILNDYIKLQ